MHAWQQKALHEYEENLVRVEAGVKEVYKGDLQCFCNYATKLLLMHKGKSMGVEQSHVQASMTGVNYCVRVCVWGGGGCLTPPQKFGARAKKQT